MTGEDKPQINGDYVRELFKAYWTDAKVLPTEAACERIAAALLKAAAPKPDRTQTHRDMRALLKTLPRLRDLDVVHGLPIDYHHDKLIDFTEDALRELLLYKPKKYDPAKRLDRLVRHVWSETDETFEISQTMMLNFLETALEDAGYGGPMSRSTLRASIENERFPTSTK